MPPDHNLLLGVLALQNQLIDRDTLIGALKSWAREPGRSLGEVLVERGDLSPPERSSLEAILSAQLARREDTPPATDAAHRTSPFASMAHASQTINLFADDDLVASLQAAGISPQLIEQSIAPPTGTLAATRIDARLPEPVAPDAPLAESRAGRFRPLKLHARGGLGEVFLAVDDELHREVALKEIQAKYAADVDARARFLREAEITGGLEHPGIVPVYGLGAYPDGRPYYAMRFIRGETLRDAINSHHANAPAEGHDIGERDLALRKLLGRFLSACNAIDYAHNRGVIHRDIKPENILIGPFGETLVVDWGLARAQGRDELRAAAGETSLHVSPSGDSTTTRQGAILGTPAYMSPEQALGWNDLLTPAADIYSLGATLYSLLTGKAPFAGSADIVSLLQRVQIGDFPKPRTANSDVPEPLEAICLKAMATKASQRYPSARAFADDIEAWLGDQPVSAYEEPWWSKAGRWVRRNRTLVAGVATASGVALVALIIGVVMLSLYNEELRVARDRAEQNEKLARKAVEKFLVRITNDKRLKSDGFEPLRKALLRDAGDFYEEFLHGEEVKTDLLSESIVATARLADISREIESAEGALKYVRRAIALNERWQAAEPGLFAPATLAVALRVKEGAVLTDLGEHEKAIETYRDAAAKAEKLAPSRKPTTQLARRLAAAEIHHRIGVALFWADRHLDSLAALTAAGRLFDQIALDAAKLKPDPASHSDSAEELSPEAKVEARLEELFSDPDDKRPREEQLRRNVTRAQVQRKTIQAEVLSNLGRNREALTYLNEARQEFEPLLAGEPDWSSIPAEWVALLGNLSNCATQEGDWKTAASDLEAARKVVDPLLERHPDTSEYRALAATILHNQAVIAFQQGDMYTALSTMRRAISMMRALHSQRPELYDYQANLGKSLGDLARIERVAGETAAIIPEMQEAIRLQASLAAGKRSATEHLLQLSSHHIFLAEWLARLGRTQEALKELQSAEKPVKRLETEFPLLPATVELRITYRAALGGVFIEMGESEQAKAVLARASQLIAEQLKANPSTILLKHQATVAMLFGAAAEATGDFAAAEKEYRSAVTVRTELAKRPSATSTAGAELASARHSLARSIVQQGLFAAGREEHGRAIAKLRELTKRAPQSAALRQQLAQSLRSRAMAAWIEFDLDDAVADGAESVRILEALAAEHPQDPNYPLDIGSAYVSLGEIERTRPNAAAALVHYSKGIERFAPLSETIAFMPPMQAAYRNARYRRAEIHVKAKRFREALADLDIARPIAASMAAEVRGLRAFTLRMLGEHDQSLQEVVDILPLIKRNTDQMASLVMFCAVAATDVAKDEAIAEADRKSLGERYSATAVVVLRALSATDFFHAAPAREFIDKDPRLANLRERPDYQAWRKGLEK